MQERPALLRPHGKHRRALRAVGSGVDMRSCLGISLVLIFGCKNPYTTLPVLDSLFL